MPCSCRCGHLCPQGLLWCHLHTTNSSHGLGSQSARLAKFENTEDYQCNTMGKTLSSHSFFSLIKEFWHHSADNFVTQHMRSCSPVTGWDVLPASTDISREADIARIKHLRNTVYAHAESASVDAATFNKLWREIRDTLQRLGGLTFKVK